MLDLSIRLDKITMIPRCFWVESEPQLFQKSHAQTVFAENAISSNRARIDEGNGPMRRVLGLQQEQEQCI